MKQAVNLLLFGPSGTGKTPLATGVAYALLEQGIRVKYVSAVNLVQQLQVARNELPLPEALTRLDRYAVLILDDIGDVRQSEQEAHVLFELIAHRYETGSLVAKASGKKPPWQGGITPEKICHPTEQGNCRQPDRIVDAEYPAHPNQVWAGDITYLRTQAGWMYLAIVMDLHSRKMIGWAMDKRMTTALVERAMQMTITLRNPGKGLIFHSDRGSQYTSKR